MQHKSTSAKDGFEASKVQVSELQECWQVITTRRCPPFHILWLMLNRYGFDEVLYALGQTAARVEGRQVCYSEAPKYMWGIMRTRANAGNGDAE